jgi:hypothetical protein
MKSVSRRDVVLPITRVRNGSNAGHARTGRSWCRPIMRVDYCSVLPGVLLYVNCFGSLRLGGSGGMTVCRMAG